MAGDSRPEQAAALDPGAGAARVPARVVDTLPYANFVQQVREQLERGRDEVYLRQHAAPEMAAKGYQEYFGRNGEVTRPASEVRTAGYRYSLGGDYVSLISRGAMAEPPRLTVPDQAREVYRAAAGIPHLSDDDRGRILVRYYQSVSHLGMMADYRDLQRLTVQNPDVAILLMRAAIAREVGIGKTEGRNGAYGIEYVVTRNLPQADGLIR